MTLQAETQRLARTLSHFGLRLHAELPSSGNLFYSPLSLGIALSMLVPGARGATRGELVEALGLEDDERSSEAVKDLLTDLARRREEWTDWDGERRDLVIKQADVLKLRVANGMFVQEAFPLHAAYVAALLNAWEAEVASVDFADAGAAAARVNGWVRDRTGGMIPTLISPESVDPTTQLILLNAVYFLGAWAQPFSTSKTRPKAFRTSTAGKVRVPRMRQKLAHLLFTRDDIMAVEAVCLPYRGNASMMVLLPDGVGTGPLERALDSPKLEALVTSMTPRPVGLELPRFELELGLGLSEPLQALGIRRAFHPTDAQFGGVTPHPEGLRVSEVVHRAKVRVDEEGTEAAAATAIVTALGAAPMKPPPYHRFIVDRPFIFLIRDDSSGAILFVGRVEDPRG